MGNADSKKNGQAQARVLLLRNHVSHFTYVLMCSDYLFPAIPQRLLMFLKEGLALTHPLRLQTDFGTR